MRDEVTILVPLDGSKLAERALAYLPLLMPLGLESVELVSVVGYDADHRHRPGEDIDREKNLLAAYLDGVAQGLRDATALRVEPKVLLGRPATSLLEEIEASGASIVVISTHGASGVERWRLGSVADKVVRSSPSPVLVVGPGPVPHEEWLKARILPSFNAVLVPLDGSELAELALPVAKRIADASGSTLHLVSVVSLRDLDGNTVWAGVSPGLTEDLSRDAQAYLQRVLVTHAIESRVSAAVRFGSPAEALQEYTEVNEIDLTVMTSHGRGGLLRSALGSTTDRLIASAKSPILVVPAQM